LELSGALAACASPIWTGNAFPIGGFHGKQVKQAAFRPSWDQPARLHYTEDAARALCALATAPTAAPLSLSTCPLGYGQDPLDEAMAIEQLRRFAAWCREWEQQHGILLRLALEPEPDGRFERVEILAAWMASAFSAEELRHLGICWDICHAEVVGEEPDALLTACRRLGVTIAKVQVSAALVVDDASTPAARARLQVLARDPYLHQVRGVHRSGQLLAYPDLAPALADPAAADASWRVHCHVPVHLGALGDGLHGSPWRPSLRAARAAGLLDFELETYTLPVLPPELTAGGLVATMVEEWRAVSGELGLTGT